MDPNGSVRSVAEELLSTSARAIGLGARGAVLARPDGVAASVSIDWAARAPGTPEPVLA